MSQSLNSSRVAHDAALVRARAALDRHENLQQGGRPAYPAGVVPPAAVPKARKAEDTAEGCRVRAEQDRSSAETVDSAAMRLRLEFSAETWTKRANLLHRLEAGRQGE